MHNSSEAQECALLLPSIHYVIQAERLLRAAALGVDLVPVPREVNPNCGMALVFACSLRLRVEELLQQAQLPLVAIYTLHKGKYRLWKKST